MQISDIIMLLSRYRAYVFGILVFAGGGGYYLLAHHSGNRHVDFNDEIRPILNEHCVTCHGGVKRKANLSFLFRSDALDTAESGKRAIVPGSPGKSELLSRVRHHDPDERMPPEGDPLSNEQIDLLHKWIETGAEWEDHWAYVKPETPEIPSVSDASWPSNEIDHFVLARLDKEGLQPSSRADCAVLLRRVSLDLIGLPPTLEEVDDFCADPSPSAYEKAVDRLLDSPHFGERWASMWLDLARYADSQGYEKDNPRSIWRYRDWVIQAFNRDMPFDQFTIEQLAGDLLPEPDKNQLIATAFHRNTMTNDEGGTDDEEFRVAAVIDRLNTTWEVWQGTTMACTQCHGHPYDPFRQEEYYQLFAFFNNTEDADRSDERPVLYEFSPENEAQGKELVRSLDSLKEQEHRMFDNPPVSQEYPAWLGRLGAYASSSNRSPAFEDHLVPPYILRIAERSPEERDAYEKARLKEFYVSVSESFAPLRERRKELTDKIRALEPDVTPIIKELPETARRTTYVFDRGNWLVRAEAVEPGVPASMPAMPERYSKNRLGLAQWLVSPDNPLTARVMVNRFWEQLFGTGIVETLEDFGTQGAPPTHPDLLDWLAMQFMHEHDWSIKKLLRQIVLSSTYQQDSSVSPELLARDARNLLLARGPRFRLSAEQVRDQALFVSGLLSNKMYGPSVMPPQPPGLWTNPYSSLEWETSPGEDAHRRGIYTFWRRTVPYPSMLTFDATSREVCVSRRIRTNTPLQALVTLNDTVYVEAARALAQRMVEEGGSDTVSRLTRGYSLALLKEPSTDVLRELQRLYESSLRHYRNSPTQREALFRNVSEQTDEMAALTVVAHAILNLDAFLTKQ